MQNPKRPKSPSRKPLLRKETIRFYSSDMDRIREVFPGGYGKPGINEIVRELVHKFVIESLPLAENEHTSVSLESLPSTPNTNPASNQFESKK